MRKRHFEHPLFDRKNVYHAKFGEKFHLEVGSDNLEKVLALYKDQASILTEEENYILSQIELTTLSQLMHYERQDGLHYMYMMKLIKEEKMDIRDARPKASIKYPKSSWGRFLSESDSEFLTSLAKKLPANYKGWVSNIDFCRHDSLLEIIMMIREKTVRRTLFEAV